MNFVSRFLDPALIEKLNHLQLSARSVVEGTISGLHRSPVKGASVEFRQHRFYSPGDELRRLDWRVLGRTDRPYIKEYDEETNLRCLLMLDASGSMSYAGKGDGPLKPREDGSTTGKFDYASRLLASLAYLMLGQTESVGIASFSSKIDHWLAPKAGIKQLSHLIDILERSTPRGPSNLGPALTEAADRLDRRALVIAVSDCFSPVVEIRKGLSRLQHDRHEAIVIQVLHQDEVHFPFKRWSRFRGMEGEKSRLCEPAIVRKVYLDNFRRHRADLEQTCRAMGAEFYSFVTERSLIESVTTLLRRRAV
ncbi:DUF58 domain-containing protein [Humisphaera borealis]|uniref:DUF58 domain-containing protein n=1 Tax=Humisphaera borealis TaxID=2807512 RepID=A0A7M2WSU6_9BACT|nr:DUF58 domain-containing protein [Humisphaera borealis]QOV87670.1 DUF58 domain-containing protein [Humisphaera borealis]